MRRLESLTIALVVVILVLGACWALGVEEKASLHGPTMLFAAAAYFEASRANRRLEP